jgi:hypothetical protein
LFSLAPAEQPVGLCNTIFSDAKKLTTEEGQSNELKFFCIALHILQCIAKAVLIILLNNLANKLEMKSLEL